MKRRIIVSVIAILLIGLAVFLLVKLENKDKVNDGNIVNGIYENVGEEIKSNWDDITISRLDLNNMEVVTYNTGLKSIDGIESIYISETSDSFYSYSFVCVKVKKDANKESIKNNIYNNIDMYKWKYVYAKKLAVVDAGEYIFAVMGNMNEVEAVVGGLKVYAEENKMTVGEVMERFEE